MPTITVSAILLDRGRILLMRPEGAGVWALPGGLLAETDASVEEALVRVLAELTGIEITEERYLDTLYERMPDGVVVHNVFFAERVAGALPQGGVRGGVELHWVEVASLGKTPLPDWLADALPALLEGEAAPGPAIDLPGLAQTTGLRALPAWLTAPAPAPVIILNGPPGAGKSTVARLLCGRFPHAAHVDTDLLRAMVVTGQIGPAAASGYTDFEHAPAEAREARRQLDVAALNAATVARNFAVAGFTAVIDGVLEYREELDVILACLGGLNVAFVTLLPDIETVQSRDAGRDPASHVGQRALELHRIMAANGETRGLRLDTSRLSAEETVEVVVQRLDDAMVQYAWELSE
jgi:ADP-ribose pyrophosphatase YjhB (NUDIX family)/chloramphenicol 3-O-phosphotransferase